MEYKYEYMFFKYLYKILDLKNLDDKLSKEKIKMIDENNSNKRISKYFALINKGNSSEFSEIEKKEYEKLFSNDLEELCKEINEEVINNFIKKTYEKYFHLNIDFKYIYYGPTSFEYMAPSDSIVIGLNYEKYNIEDDDNFEEELSRQEEIVVKVLNYIQNDLAKENKIKLSAIAYNEIALSQPFVRL